MEKIQASTPADLIAYVSHALRYTPSESFVFMLFNGTAMSASLRIDTPAGNAHATGWAVRAVSYLLNDEDADRVAAPCTRTGPPPTVPAPTPRSTPPRPANCALTIPASEVQYVHQYEAHIRRFTQEYPARVKQVAESMRATGKRACGDEPDPTDSVSALRSGGLGSPTWGKA